MSHWSGTNHQSWDVDTNDRLSDDRYMYLLSEENFLVVYGFSWRHRGSPIYEGPLDDESTVSRRRRITSPIVVPLAVICRLYAFGIHWLSLETLLVTRAMSVHWELSCS